MGIGETIMFINLNDEPVQIDDEIAEEIITLNKKGYKTFTCCAGHNTPDSFYGYIFFENRLPRKYGEPDGWGRDCDILDDDDEQKYWKQSKRTIRYFMWHSVGKEKQDHIDHCLKSLKEWVNNLPDLSK
jgi:hypothetical protein